MNEYHIIISNRFRNDFPKLLLIQNLDMNLYVTGCNHDFLRADFLILAPNQICVEFRKPRER